MAFDVVFVMPWRVPEVASKAASEERKESFVETMKSIWGVTALERMTPNRNAGLANEPKVCCDFETTGISPMLKPWIAVPF